MFHVFESGTGGTARRFWLHEEGTKPTHTKRVVPSHQLFVLAGICLRACPAGDGERVPPRDRCRQKTPTNPAYPHALWCLGSSSVYSDVFLFFLVNQNKMASFLGYSRDTVAVALNYFDRYTCAEPCSPTLAQAVAATALHVAAKFEESKPASLVRPSWGVYTGQPSHAMNAPLDTLRYLSYNRVWQRK